MEDFFLNILIISIYASVLIILVTGLRHIFKKAPRNIFLLLWGIVAIRLLCPVSFENVFSLIPEPTQAVQTVLDSNKNSDAQRTAQTTDGSKSVQVNSTKNITKSSVDSSANRSSETKFDFKIAWQDLVNDLSLLKCLSYIWILGIVVGAAYSLFIYIRLKRRLSKALPVDGYYLIDDLDQPCVAGYIHPRIYIPYNLEECCLPYVLAHECAHIRRKDVFLKLFWYIILLIYWFNPVIWLAYHLMGSDMEQACDETVVRKYTVKEKAAYANALLDCAVVNGNNVGMVLGFGKGSLKRRILNLKGNHKISKKHIILGICGCMLIAVLFGCGYRPEENSSNSASVKSSDDKSVSNADSSDKDSNADTIVWKYDVTHDGIDDKITINLSDMSGIKANKNVCVYSGKTGKKIWSETVNEVHVWRTGYYIYEKDNEYYLMEWNPQVYTDNFNYYYKVFSLSDTGKKNMLASDKLLFCGEDYNAKTKKSIIQFTDGLNQYLSKSFVLIDTANGAGGATDDLLVNSTSSKEIVQTFDPSSDIESLKEEKQSRDSQ